MKELVEYIVKSLVDKPEAVSVKETQGDSITIIEVRTAPEDAGKVIGKEGKMIKSIKNLLKIRAIKENIFALVDSNYRRLRNNFC